MIDEVSRDPPAHPLRWLVLVLVAVGTFMSTLDVSIVNVAMPTLTDTFNTTVATSQWFVLSYILVITMLLLAFGKLGDLVGRRRLYLHGILIFIAGSLACALSVSALMLILARACQGIGSAMTMSAGPAMLTEGFPARERGKALGFMGMAVAFGLLAGPVIGGLLVRYASWRWMFFINIPVGLGLAILLATRVRGYDTRTDGRLDVPGAVLMGAALAALILGLTYGKTLGWASVPSIAIFAFAAAAGTAFIATERRAQTPMLDLALFKNREFTIGAVTGWTNYAALIPISVFLPFYLQNLLGYKPDHVGLILASGPLTLAFIAPLAGSLSDRIGSRLLTTAGLVILGAGILSMRALTPESTWLDVVARLVVASTGSAMFVSPNSSSVLGSVPPGDLGIASGTIALVRSLGMVCGVAAAGAIITSAQGGFLVGLKGMFVAGTIVAVAGSLVSVMRVGRWSIRRA